jgi:murein DD-endopeptidase MepM/ murein hydrolase activator NlpD
LRAVGIAGLALAAGMVAAAAQDILPERIIPERITPERTQVRAPEMKSPRISLTHVDWDAAAAELNTIDALKPAEAGEPRPSTLPMAPGELVAKLNQATGERFAHIAASPVPVLLPFDTAAFLGDRTPSAGTPDAGSGTANAPNYLFGFNAVPFFYPGPGGYDAVVLARAQEMRELGVGFAEPIYIHIGGSALVYELDEPSGLIGWPVKGLDDIPGIRRTYLENYVRYTFVRYGVPYVVAIECFDGGSRFRKISCRNADKVAVRFLRSLRVVGGTPRREPAAIGVNTIERPEAQSTVFTYHGPGDLIPGTGFKRRGGVADYTVYSKIRFPIADAPAFANSQSFMNWGNCEATGRSGAGRVNGVAAYRCRVGGQTLIPDESAADNYSYPWRDNFCEHRFFYVGQCPAGLGHQGQDIRPSWCKQRMAGANRCEPYQHDVVAVRDGAVLRAPGQESIYIVANSPNERIRFRYLHMQPKQFDANGLLSGRFVREGEVIGKVANYFKRERGTTYHLHFDVQVPTKYGWVFVNPYMTLVAAYERLIRGRGQEIRPDTTPEIGEDVPTASIPPKPGLPPPAQAPASPEMPSNVAAKPTETPVESRPATTIEPGILHDERMERTAEPSPVTASVPADLGNGNGGAGDLERDGDGAKQQIGLRPMGRGFSRPGPRAWHIRRHLHPRDEQYQARHGGL